MYSAKSRLESVNSRRSGIKSQIESCNYRIADLKHSVDLEYDAVRTCKAARDRIGADNHRYRAESFKDALRREYDIKNGYYTDLNSYKSEYESALNDLRNALIINIVTYLVIEGFSKNEIKEFIKVSTNLINKVIKTVQESKEVEIKEHPSIRGKKSRLVELKKDIETLTDIVESLKKEIEEIREETKNTLMSLSEEGKNAEQIGKEMGESSQTIRNWCEKYGITLKKSAQGRPKKTKVEERHYIISFSEMFENKKGLD